MEADNNQIITFTKENDTLKKQFSDLDLEIVEYRKKNKLLIGEAIRINVMHSQNEEEQQNELKNRDDHENDLNNKIKEQQEQINSLEDEESNLQIQIIEARNKLKQCASPKMRNKGKTTVETKTSLIVQFKERLNGNSDKKIDKFADGEPECGCHRSNKILNKKTKSPLKQKVTWKTSETNLSERESKSNERL